MSLVNRMLRDLAERPRRERDVLEGLETTRSQRHGFSAKRFAAFALLVAALTGALLLVPWRPGDNGRTAMPRAPVLAGREVPDVEDFPLASVPRLPSQPSGARLVGLRQSAADGTGRLEFLFHGEPAYRLDGGSSGEWRLEFEAAAPAGLLELDDMPGLSRWRRDGRGLSLWLEEGWKLTETIGSTEDEHHRLRLSISRERTESAKTEPLRERDIPQPRLAAVPDSEASGGGTMMQRRSREPDPRVLAEHAAREAHRALRAGQPERAEQLYRRALDWQPGDHDLRAELASLLRERQHLEEALYLLDQGLAGDPGAASLRKLKARVLLERGEAGRALQVLAEHAPGVAQDPEYHGFLAALHQRRGQHREAERIYREIVRERPEQSRWWMGWGVSLEALDQPAKALEAYRQARRTGRLSASVRRWVESRIRTLENGGATS